MEPPPTCRPTSSAFGRRVSADRHHQAVSSERESFVPLPNLPRQPGIIGALTFYARSFADLQEVSIRRDVRGWLSTRSGKILDVGCGGQPYRGFLPDECDYTGLDWEGAASGFGYASQATVYYEGNDFPFPDETFDNLFHTEVLEHVPETDHFLRECRRVLRKGSEMFFTVPFQARFHFVPFDHWRFTPTSLNTVLARANFVDIRIRNRGTDQTVAAYKVAAVGLRLLRGSRSSKAVGALVSPLTFVSLLAGHLSLWSEAGSSDDCLGYTVTATAG